MCRRLDKCASGLGYGTMVIYECGFGGIQEVFKEMKGVLGIMYTKNVMSFARLGE